MGIWLTASRAVHGSVHGLVHGYIVRGQGASQLGGSLLGIPPGYKANKLIRITKQS